jgi:hypothetical protein
MHVANALGKGGPFPGPLLPAAPDNRNRKGLISKKGEKKLASYILHKACMEHAPGKPE